MAGLESRLKLLREKKDLKQKDVAAQLNIEPSTLSRYETGERTSDPTVLVKLADFYEVTTDYLLTGKTNGNGQSKPWWERDEIPTDIELEEFIRKHDNIRLMGNPLDEQDKDDVLLAMRVALEYIKRERKRAAEATSKEG